MTDVDSLMLDAKQAIMEEHQRRFQTLQQEGRWEEALQQIYVTLTRIIHDGSSRNRAVAMRDRRAEPRGREAYLKQYVDRPSGEPACLDAGLTASRLVVAANPRLQQKRS